MRRRCPWCRFYFRKNEETIEYKGKEYHKDCVKALIQWARIRSKS